MYTNYKKVKWIYFTYINYIMCSADDPGVDVVISDPSCPAAIVRRCHQLDVPLVSSEWVAQCLINGTQVNFDSHYSYKYDYS